MCALCPCLKRVPSTRWQTRWQPERLVCFGFSSLEHAFLWKGVRLEILDSPRQQKPTEALVQDLLTIVSVFAGRL
jgi:predicted site-specific integrase-resolvase